MKIAVLGTGAIGSVFAAALASVNSNEVLCIMRTGKHAAAVNENGITVIEPDGRRRTSRKLRAVTDTKNEKPADLVIVMVKSYSTEEAVTSHPEIFGLDTIVLTLQNGYGNHEALRTVAADDHILMGTTAHGANIRADGAVMHAGTGATHIGPLAGSDPEALKRAETAAAALSEAGFDTDVCADAADTVFRKLLINIGINALSAVNDTPNRYILENAGMKEAARQLVEEACDVLALYGYDYDRRAAWESVADVVRLTGDNICSMLADVRAGRPTEIQAINGAVVRMAEDKGAAAPHNADIVKKAEAISQMDQTDL